MKTSHNPKTKNSFPFAGRGGLDRRTAAAPRPASACGSRLAADPGLRPARYRTTTPGAAVGAGHAPSWLPRADLGFCFLLTFFFSLQRSHGGPLVAGGFVLSALVVAEGPEDRDGHASPPLPRTHTHTDGAAPASEHARKASVPGGGNERPRCHSRLWPLSSLQPFFLQRKEMEDSEWRAPGSRGLPVLGRAVSVRMCTYAHRPSRVY